MVAVLGAVPAMALASGGRVIRGCRRFTQILTVFPSSCEIWGADFAAQDAGAPKDWSIVTAEDCVRGGCMIMRGPCELPILL